MLCAIITFTNTEMSILLHLGTILRICSALSVCFVVTRDLLSKLCFVELLCWFPRKQTQDYITVCRHIKLIKLGLTVVVVKCVLLASRKAVFLLINF
jgi:hypothetical protein